jgi:hypothetical protein
VAHLEEGGTFVEVGDTSSSLEATRLISDWGKWIVTIETAAIAIIGALFRSDHGPVAALAKVFGTLAIGCFLISITAAAILLLTLPEIAQSLRAGQNIWLTRDSVAGRLLRMNTQAFALTESVFFGCGLVALVGMILVMIWS